VTLFPMFRTVETWPEVRRSVPRDVEVMLGQAADGLAAFLAERRGSFEAIVVCRPHNMRAFLDAGGGDPAITGGARIIYDAEAVFAPREVQAQAYAGKPMPPAEIESRLAEEIALARQADTVMAVSTADARLFEAHGIADVHLLGHALRVDPTTEDFTARNGILFVGAMHGETSPNADSLRWFAAEILPILRNKLGIPDLRLKVVGFNKAASIAALDGIALDLVGMVDDLRPHFATARLVVAPTRIAAGLPHKIGHAAALGVPVVVTTLLAEQLGWLPGRDLLAASDAESFAEACGALYQDQALWERVRDAALQRCGEDYAPACFAATVADLLDAVPARATPPARAVRPLLPDYADWIRAYDTLSRADRAAIRAHIASFTRRPLISVVVPLYNTPEVWLRRCIDSVRDQLYGNWELCLADDASPQPHVAAICRQYAAMDSRIRFVSRTTRGHIAAASNTALDVASGEFVALLDHDDELADHALYMVAAALEQDPALDLVFSDEDKIDELGTRREPWFKPGWDPDLMRSQNAVVHLAVYRRNLLREIGGFRAGFDGSQDYDLTLRFAERTDPKRIRRLPFVLYHWRAIPGSVALATDQKDYPYQAAARAIQEHLDRIGSGAQVTREAHPGYYRVHWPVPEQPKRVTIIIPTRDRLKLLRTAVESILAKTTYPDFEILVIDNGSSDPATVRYLRDLGQRPRVRVLRDDRPYSFAGLNNRAVAQTDAPLLAFVNNDVEVINPAWLAEMVAHALRPDVGAVGAKLYYPNDTVQHAGIVVGIGGLAGHPHVGLARGEPGYFGRAAVAQRFAAVTAACMVMRREIFMELGGFDEDAFAVAFNDVDLGLRLNAAGYGVVWTPYAELVHHESASLGLPNSDERREQFDRECDNLIARWDSVITDDPFYNPNLTITGGDYAPAFPPRARKPWQDYFAVKDR
jgi:O-antigen biosynthesis protein